MPKNLPFLLIPDPDPEEPVCFTHCQRLLRRYCKSTRQLKLKETVLPDKICLEVTQLKKAEVGTCAAGAKVFKTLSLLFYCTLEVISFILF